MKFKKTIVFVSIIAVFIASMTVVSFVDKDAAAERHEMALYETLLKLKESNPELFREKPHQWYVTLEYDQWSTYGDRYDMLYSKRFYSYEKCTKQEAIDQTERELRREERGVHNVRVYSCRQED